MAISDQIKYKVISRLQNNEKPAMIADELDIPYSTVIRLNREFKEAKANGDVATILNLDEALFAEVVEEVKANTTPGLADAAAETLSELQSSKNAMDHLQLDLQLAAKVIVDKVKIMAMGVENVSEVEGLAETLCKLQNAFFNKNTTQVNVQNNYGTDGKYRSLLSDTPQLPSNNRNPVQ